jgi:putative salt-induced outer membrane protein YdiY
MPRRDLAVMRPILRSLLAAGVALAASVGHADKVRLQNGDIVTGEIVETSAAGVVLVHPVLGKLTIAADQIEAQVDGDAALPALPAPPPPPRPGLFGTGLLAGWNKQIQLGFNGASGNSDNRDLLAGVRGNYADERKRWQFDSGYFRSSTEGDETKNQAFALLLRDFLFTGTKYFAFASTRYDYDQFQNWDHRLNLAGGAGYSFIDRDKFDLRGRAGFGGTKTFGSPGDDEWVPEAVLGLETEWLPADRQKLTAYTTFYPSLSDGGEFRSLSGVDWSLLISDGLGLSLNLGIQNEYESDVPAGIEKNDLLYRAALLYDF